MKNFVYFPVGASFVYEGISAKFLEHLKRNELSYEKVFNILSDDYSKEVFYKVFACRLLFFQPHKIDETQLLGKAGEYSSYLRKAKEILTIIPDGIDEHTRHDFAFCMAIENYRYKDIVVPHEGDIVIDSGAFIGDTAFWFAKSVKDKGKVFAFEPADSTYDILTHNIKVCGLDNVVTPVKYGLSNKEDFANFTELSESLCSSAVTINGDTKIKLTTIDEFVEKESLPRIDFIKMDVEGSEFDALEGSQETI